MRAATVWALGRVVLPIGLGVSAWSWIERPAVEPADVVARAVPSSDFCEEPLLVPGHAFAYADDCAHAGGPRLVRIDRRTGAVSTVAQHPAKALTAVSGGFVYIEPGPHDFVVHRYVVATGDNIGVRVSGPTPDLRRHGANAGAPFTISRDGSKFAMQRDVDGDRTEIVSFELVRGATPKIVEVDPRADGAPTQSTPRPDDEHTSGSERADGKPPARRHAPRKSNVARGSRGEVAHPSEPGHYDDELGI